MAEINWGLLQNDPVGEQSRAFSYADQIAQSAARYRAGGLYAQGDYTGAARIQAQAGDIPQAQQTQAYGAQISAGGQYAQGDYTGAAQTQARAGNIQQAQQTQAYGQKTASAGEEYFARAVKTFSAIAQAHANDPDGGRSALAYHFDAITPEAKAVTGASDQQLAQIKQALITDPQATLAHLQSRIPVEYKQDGDTLLQFRGDDLLNSYTGGKQLVVNGKIVDVPFSVNGPPGATPASPPAAMQPQAASGGFTQQAVAPTSPGAIIPAADPSAMHAVESGNDPNAVSPAGAVGVSQTMPATLANPGFGVAPAANNSPQEQQRVGDQYLQALNQHYGNPVVAAIAYNWGPGNTNKWLAAGGDVSKLPAETQQYLARLAVTQALPRPGSAPGAVGPAQPGQQPGAPRVIYDGGPEWRPPTAAESKQYPGVTQVNSATGAVKYPPMAMTPSQLSPDAIKQGAAFFIQNGGKFPGTMRDRQSIAAIQNYVATLKPPGMSDGDWARVIQNNGLSLTGRKAAVGQASKGQVGTAIDEGTVNNSINILRKVMPIAASRGTFTTLNNLQQYIGRATNDAGAANFKNAVDSITAEYARVMTGTTNGSASSDAARASAEQRILLGYNSKTLDQVLNQMQSEMRGRSDAYASVLNEVTGGAYNGPSVPNTPAPQTAPNSPQGKIAPQDIVNELRRRGVVK